MRVRWTGLHVLFATPSLARPGGVTRSVCRAVRALRAAGHRVSVFSPDEALFPDDLRFDGDDVTFGPRVRGGPSEAAVAEQANVLVEQTARFARRPDVLLGYYATSAGRAAVQAARALGLPAVVAARGNDVDRDLAPGSACAAAVRQAFVDASAVMAVSREMVAKIHGHTGVRATFVTNAVDRTQFYPDAEGARAFAARFELDPRRPVLGLFGELKQKRGLERLRALPQGTLDPFQVVVVGRVREEARALLPEGTRVLGYFEDDAVLRGAYCACAALLQPSTFDGMPNVVLEAMACGTPVLVSRAGGLSDLVEDGVTGSICDDAGAWIAALRRIQEGRLASLAEAARLRAPTAETERDGILDVLHDAIRRYAASSASR